jgi:dephospho-CoA kinase
METTTGTTTAPTTTTTHRKRPIIIVEAAMLLDAHWYDDILDGVWVVTTTKDAAIQRLIEKRQLSYETSFQRYNAQLHRRGSNMDMIQTDLQNKIITAIISNHQTIDDLKQQLYDTLSNPNLYWYPRS